MYKHHTRKECKNNDKNEVVIVMRLSDLDIDFNRLVKDGEFEHFGLMNSTVSGGLFVYYGDSSYRKQLDNPNIACVICPPDLIDDLPSNIKGIYLSDDSKYEFFNIFNAWGMESDCDDGFETKIGNNCIISDKANIAKRNVIIGDDCVIEEFVTIKEHTVLEKGVCIGAGSVIGRPGMQVARGKANMLVSVNHFGGVIIRNYTEIHSMVSVDQALFSWDNTVIGERTHIGAHSNIAHGCKIGDRTLIASGVMLGGTSTIGDDVWIGIGVSAKHQTKIGDRAQVMMGSVVRKNIENDMVMVGDIISTKDKYYRLQHIVNENANP